MLFAHGFAVSQPGEASSKQQGDGQRFQKKAMKTTNQNYEASAPANVRPSVSKNNPQPVRAWRGIFFDGPEPEQNRDGDEIPVWFVYVGDKDAAPVGTVYKPHNFKSAEGLAKRMSRDRRLELIHEAMPA